MTGKRRDKKGRILRNGESQRADGRYAYVYVDKFGKQRFLYSWKLESTDKLPQGKRECISLRDKIKELQKDLSDGVCNYEKMTVAQAMSNYINRKAGLKKSAKKLYKSNYNLVCKDKLGKLDISKVKLNDAKEFVFRLYNLGYKRESILVIVHILKPALQDAVDDDIIRKNPFDFKVSDLLPNDTNVRKALTFEQEERFLNFIQTEKHFSRFYDLIFILLNTGLRVSELCGLTIDDVNFEQNKISVNKQLLYGTDGFYIETPKSISGIRDIPLSKEVSAAFLRVLEDRKISNAEPIIDGISNFIFITILGNPYNANTIAKIFGRVNSKKSETQLPHITAHVCRHTFCSKMIRNGMKPKTLQYIMGHSDISTTLNIYTHITFEDVQDEFEQIYLHN